MQPDDIRHIHALSDPRLHPDGHRVVLAVSHPDLDEDTTVSALWLVDGDEVRAFTHGPNDSRPRWSPDGRWLAFLRTGTDDDAKPQVVVMPADGGEATAITDFPLGASEAEWAPDSSRLAVVGSVWQPHLADLDADERARRARRITTFPYREDDAGWVADRRTHVYVVDREGQECRALTAGDARDEGIAWHPDGTTVAFLSTRHDGAGLQGSTQPLGVDAGGGDAAGTAEPAALGPVGDWEWAGFDPTGAVLLGGLEDPLDWPDNVRLWRMEEDGPVDLLAVLDRSTLDLSPPGPVHVSDGMLVGVADRGRVRLLGVADLPLEDPTAVRDLVPGNRVVLAATASTDATTDASAGAIYAVVADPHSPGELYKVGPDGLDRLTDFNAALAERDLCPVERFAVPRDDVELDAWAVLPPGDGPWPVLLNIHGGPTAQYDDAFFDEFQVYASAGYLVVGTNPRGSSGRGRDWCRAVVGAWTDPDSVDMLDLRAVVDAALARWDRADPERIGIMGGSYGGFSTARIIARDHRYASAIVERGLLSWPSFGGTSDIGPFFDRMFLQSTLPDDWEALHAASPLALAGDVEAATLVIHSDEDWRCPVEQGEQYFLALLRAGVSTELWRVPGEGHELSRSGSPKHRVERFEAILDWHARHLDMPGPGALDGADGDHADGGDPAGTAGAAGERA